MGIKVIKSEIPQPLANYSEASQAGDLIFAAGQLASDWKDGVPKEARKHPNFPFYGSDIKLQTDYILKNLAKTFKAAGTSLDNVVKAQVFLMDLNDFAGFDEVWRSHFKSPPPRTTVGTTGLLVKDTLVEIDLIATLPGKPISSDQVRRTQAAGELFRSDSRRRSRFRRRSACQRLQDRRAGDSQARRKLPILRIGHPAADRIHPGESQADIRGCRKLAWITS